MVDFPLLRYFSKVYHLIYVCLVARTLLHQPIFFVPNPKMKHFTYTSVTVYFLTPRFEFHHQSV